MNNIFFLWKKRERRKCLKEVTDDIFDSSLKQGIQRSPTIYLIDHSINEHNIGKQRQKKEKNHFHKM